MLTITKSNGFWIVTKDGVRIDSFKRLSNARKQYPTAKVVK